MSLISANNIEKNLHELKIGIDAETFAAAVSKVYKKQIQLLLGKVRESENN